MSYVDQFTTEFGKHLFYQSPLQKEKISPEMLLEITEAFCIREHCTFVSVDISPEEMTFVKLFRDEDVTLDLLDHWQKAFKQQGYDPPILDIDVTINE